VLLHLINIFVVLHQNLMRKFLSLLVAGESLDYEQALEAITLIGTGEANPAQTAAFLMGIQQKEITADELAGFRQGMLNLTLNLGFEDIDAMDVCGTGGDGKDTFNISTTSAFVAAGAGVKIAKHGNHGVSSAVGSSTVLEYLGVKFTNDKDYLRTKIETAGICYLHAPLFHPAMKAVAPIRKELGIKTFFNILGPLMNPAKVKKQLTGVSDLKTFELYKTLFSKSGGDYAVVHALDGYDEISLTGDFRVSFKSKDEILSPEKVGLLRVNAVDLGGGETLEDSANILIKILKGEGTPSQVNAVLANAGLAASIAKDVNFEEGIAMAKESLDSGNALKSLKKLTE
jgi:anthranilate phosphoribosyltransferase